MPTNLNINDELLAEALQLGQKKTKRETVNEALLEYVQRRKKLEILESFGTVEFFHDYDYKKARSH